MSMSKKDFEAVAAVFNKELTGPSSVCKLEIARIARDLADEFKRSNTRFRYDRFFEACGLDPFGEVKP